MTTIGTEDLGRYAGVGLTLERVIEEELWKVGATPLAPAEACDDLVIWERNKVAALIRIGPDHRPVVTRFDRPAEPSNAPGAGIGVEMGKMGHAGDELSLHALAKKETRAAIASYLAMKHCAEQDPEHHQGSLRDGAFAPPDDGERAQWEIWTRLAREAAIVSGRHLFHCILVLNRKVESLADLGDPDFRWPSCGVILDDCLFLAPGGETGTTPVVLELRNVVRLDQPRGD